MIKQTVEAGHARNISISLCGEMAGDVMCALVLIGMGLDELSMRPRCHPRIKRLLRHSSTDRVRDLGERVLQCEDSNGVREFLAATLVQYYSKDFY